MKPILSVNFESTLSFVDIPVPDFPEAKSKQTVGTLMRDEVRRILHWLRCEKKVTGIYELRVRDSRYVPHCEEVIDTCLCGFDIEILDWERLDLSLEPLKKTCPNLTHLTLYASSWTSLQYWTSEDAMCIFGEFLKKIRKVIIVVVEDLIGRQSSKQYLAMAQERLDALFSDSPSSFEKYNVRRDVFQVAIKPWPTPQSLMDQNKPVPQTTAIEATRLTQFLEKYKILQREFSDEDWRSEMNLKWVPRIKVVSIDTGVDTGSIACSQIYGASFIPSGTGGGESPWWFAQYSHGTQVAKIITEIDPYCEFLVAKVGDFLGDMTTQRVIDAFKWALECDADIISMSATIKKHRELDDVVADAISKGVVVIGSTTGEGYANEEAWLAGFERVLAIGASKLTGKETDETIRSNAKYMFPGKDILVSTSFLGSEPWDTEVSGTSFATAIAAGVASLILSCRMIALSCGDDREIKADKRNRRRIVKKTFDEMGKNEGAYVKPWTVFYQKNEHASWGEAESILNWVRKEFGPRDGRS